MILTSLLEGKAAPALKALATNELPPYKLYVSDVSYHPPARVKYHCMVNRALERSRRPRVELSVAARDSSRNSNCDLLHEPFIQRLHSAIKMITFRDEVVLTSKLAN